MQTKRMRRVCAWAVLVAAAGACSCGPKGHAATDVYQAVVQRVRMSLSLPSAAEVRNVAVAASDVLLLGDRSELLVGPDRYADSCSVGPGMAHYGTGVKVGSITATGGVRVLRDSTVSGAIRAGKDVLFGDQDSTDPSEANVSVAGTIVSNTTVAAQTLTWDVPFDAVSRSETIGANTTLAPGGYGSLNIQRGTLTLSAGTYYVDSLTLEPTANIVADTSNGPIFVYVRTSYVAHGAWSSTSPNSMLLGYLGTQLLAVEKSFAGTIVAPNARVRLAVGGGTHVGAVFAKEVELDPDVKLTFQGFSHWDTLLPDRTVDSDCDGAPDTLEVAAGLNPKDPSDGASDLDGDGIPAKEELLLGGNPSSADTDGDGILDSADLPANTDFDGDGKAYSNDNCPTKVNPGQEDFDGDGLGDVCDSTPTGQEETSLAPLVLYRSAAGDAALAPPGNFSTRRIRTDLKGLYPTEWGVLAFQTPVGDMTRAYEMWHPSGAHAYAITEGERSSLAARGYQEVGTAGYFSPAPPPIGVPVKVRRFAKATSGLETHAFAVKDDDVAALTGEGYAEIDPLGYALQDEGALVRSTLVIRYVDAAGAYHYRFSALGEEDRSGWASGGRQFRVLARGSRWTVPLYRLVDAAGAEALAISSELPDLVAQGFRVRAVLGYAYPVAGAVEALEPLQTLHRVTGPGKPTIYTTTPTELRALLAGGYTAAVPLARVVALRGLDLFREGRACAGEATEDARIRDRFAGSTPTAIAGKTLLGLTTACTLHRIASGASLSAEEQTVRDRLGQLDPIVVQTATSAAERILSLSAVERAALLGPLSELDPGACAGPVDARRTSSAIAQALSGDVGRYLSGSGDPDPSLQWRDDWRVRSPQPRQAPGAAVPRGCLWKRRSRGCGRSRTCRDGRRVWGDSRVRSGGVLSTGAHDWQDRPCGVRGPHGRARPADGRSTRPVGQAARERRYPHGWDLQEHRLQFLLGRAGRGLRGRRVPILPGRIEPHCDPPLRSELLGPEDGAGPTHPRVYRRSSSGNRRRGYAGPWFDDRSSEDRQRAVGSL